MKIDVKHVAKLANLTISEKELKKFEKQLAEVLNHVDKLKEIDTEKVAETSQVTGLENVTRDDETSPSFPQNEALSNSKSTHNGLFKVKGVLSEK